MLALQLFPLFIIISFDSICFRLFFFYLSSAVLSEVCAVHCCSEICDYFLFVERFSVYCVYKCELVHGECFVCMRVSF